MKNPLEKIHSRLQFLLSLSRAEIASKSTADLEEEYEEYLEPEIPDGTFHRQPVRASIRIEVKTSEYQFAHGKMPRGTGCWMFHLEGHGCRAAMTISPPSCTFTEAKKWAVKKARAQGFSTVTVCS